VDYFIPRKFNCQVCGTFPFAVCETSRLSHALIVLYSTTTLYNTTLVLIIKTYVMFLVRETYSYLSGEDCTLTLPIIKQGITGLAPPCPFAKDDRVLAFVIPLGKSSPTLGVPTHFAGHMTVKRKKKAVAQISIVATVV